MSVRTPDVCQDPLMGPLSGVWWNLSYFSALPLYKLGFFFCCCCRFPAFWNVFQSSFLAAWHLCGMRRALQQFPSTFRRGWHVSPLYFKPASDILYKKVFSRSSFVWSHLGEQVLLSAEVMQKCCDEKCNLETKSSHRRHYPIEVHFESRFS